MNAISKNNSALMQKWGKRIALTEKTLGKPLSIDRKNTLAATLENTQHLLEATQVQSVGGSAGSYKRWALDIVNAAVPNTIMYDFVSVQPMSSRVGIKNCAIA